MATPTTTPKRKYHTLSEKANAIKKLYKDKLSVGQMERSSKISRKSLSDWLLKVPISGSNRKRLP